MFQNSSCYNATNENQYRIVEEILQKYSKFLKLSENSLILDVGSGSGNVTSNVILPFLPVCNFHLVGVDKSKQMVDFANKHFKDPRLTFRVLDITEENEGLFKSVFIEKEQKCGFDLVFSFFCLQWTRNYHQSYRNIYSLMKPGGRLLTLTVVYSKINELLEQISYSEKWQSYFKDAPDLKFPLHASDNPSREFTILLKKLGFQNITCSHEQTLLLPGNLQYIPIRKMVEPINPYVQFIPKNLQSEYMDDVTRVFDLYLKEKPGVPYDIVISIARKPLL